LGLFGSETFVSLFLSFAKFKILVYIHKVAFTDIYAQFKVSSPPRNMKSKIKKKITGLIQVH